MNNLFTVEETNLICIFQSDSRAKVIEGIHKAMKHIDDDELLELSVRVAGKLESIGRICRISVGSGRIKIW